MYRLHQDKTRKDKTRTRILVVVVTIHEIIIITLVSAQ